MTTTYVPDTRPREILLVEDHLGDVRLVEEALKESKVHSRLHRAIDGEEAMNFLRRQEGYTDAPVPDLIFLDLNMPRKNGHEVLAEIKEDSVLKHIPVVILTSSQTKADLLKTYDLHANAYVVKPIDLDQFIESVRAIEDFWFEIVALPHVKAN